MTLTFVRYEVLDSGISLQFNSPDPGAGKTTEYSLLVTDAELSTISSLAEFNSFIMARMSRKLKAEGISTKLDSLIGRSVVI